MDITGTCEAIGCTRRGVLVEDERGHRRYACTEDREPNDTTLEG